MATDQWKQWSLLFLWSTSASFLWAESPENLKDVTRRYLREKRPVAEVIMEGSYYDAQEGIDVIKVMIKEDNQVKGLKLDSRTGREIKEKTPPPPQKTALMLRQMMDGMKDSDSVEVEVYLNVPTDHSIDMEPTSMSLDNTNPARPILRKNGKGISQKEVDALSEKHRNALIKKAEKRNRLVAEKADELRYRYSLAKSADTSDTSGFFKMRLTKHQIEQMTDESDDLIQIITSKTPPPTPTRSLYDATYSIGVAQYSYVWGLAGKGVGVWIDEALGLPDSNNPWLNMGLVTYQTPWLPADVHATQVALSYFAAAPESRIYASKTYGRGIWGETPGVCGDRLDILFQGNPPVYIANLSWEWRESYGAPYPYQNCDRVWDNFVYERNITVFAAAGNIEPPKRPQTVVGSPGKALNLITVGAYNDATNTMADFSAYANSNMRNEKPEIVAPGVSLDIGQWVGQWQGPTKGPGNSGTSFASPLAAGFAASLTSSNIGYYGRHPEIIKAALMAGATRNIEGSSRLSEKDGAGVINYRPTANHFGQWWRGGHNDFFDANQNININYSMVKGKKYRVAIVWLVNGTYQFDHMEPHMDLDLRVSYQNIYSEGSLSVYNAFEIVEITPSISGVHTISISKYSDSGQGNLQLGLAVVEVP